MLERHGFTFDVTFGQNFLTDTNILSKFVDTAEIDDQVNVIISRLTRDCAWRKLLAERAAVMALRLKCQSRRYPVILTRDRSHEDILKVDLAQHIQNFKNPNLPIKVEPIYLLALRRSSSCTWLRVASLLASLWIMMQKKWQVVLRSPNTKAYGSCRLRCITWYWRCLYRASYGLCASAKRGLSYLEMVRRSRTCGSRREQFLKVSKASFTHRRSICGTTRQAILVRLRKPRKLTKASWLKQVCHQVYVRSSAWTEFASLADALKHDSKMQGQITKPGGFLPCGRVRVIYQTRGNFRKRVIHPTSGLGRLFCGDPERLHSSYSRTGK